MMMMMLVYVHGADFEAVRFSEGHCVTPGGGWERKAESMVVVYSRRAPNTATQCDPRGDRTTTFRRPPIL
jgi:hypothetical protein